MYGKSITNGTYIYQGNAEEIMARGTKLIGLTIDIDVDDKGYVKGVDVAKKKATAAAGVIQSRFNKLNFTKLATRVKDIGKKFALLAVTAGVALTAIALKLVGVASMAEETGAKFDTVFRDLSASARQWAEDFGQSVGRARQDVQSWMAGLQDTFVPLGIARDKAFELSKSLVTLAVDVASFNNKVDEEVIRDFTSALVGNHETVRKFGVIISESAIKQAAFNAGIDKTYSQLTDLEKVMLRYDIILRGTTDAQGDAIRTSESYANQVKRLRANLTDTAEMLGNKLIPRFTEIVKLTNEWIKENQDLISTKADVFFGKIFDALEGIAKHKGIFVDVFAGVGQMATWISNIADNLVFMLTAAKNFVTPKFFPTPTNFQRKLQEALAGQERAFGGRITIAPPSTPTPTPPLVDSTIGLPAAMDVTFMPVKRLTEETKILYQEIKPIVLVAQDFRENWQKALQDVADNATTARESFMFMFQDIQDGFSDTMSRFILEGGNMRDFLISVANDVRRAFAQKISQDVTQGLFNLGASLFAGDVSYAPAGSGGGGDGILGAGKIAGDGNDIRGAGKIAGDTYIKVDATTAEKILAIVKEDQSMNGILSAGEY